MASCADPPGGAVVRVISDEHGRPRRFNVRYDADAEVELFRRLGVNCERYRPPGARFYWILVLG